MKKITHVSAYWLLSSMSNKQIDYISSHRTPWRPFWISRILKKHMNENLFDGPITYGWTFFQTLSTILEFAGAGVFQAVWSYRWGANALEAAGLLLALFLQQT